MPSIGSGYRCLVAKELIASERLKRSRTPGTVRSTRGVTKELIASKRLKPSIARMPAPVLREVAKELIASERLKSPDMVGAFHVLLPYRVVRYR